MHLRNYHGHIDLNRACCLTNADGSRYRFRYSYAHGPDSRAQWPSLRAPIGSLVESSTAQDDGGDEGAARLRSYSTKEIIYGAE